MFTGVAELSNDDIREAAEETGLSPEEVRLALRENDIQVPAVRRGDSRMPAPTRGATAHNAENALTLPAKEAVRVVRSSLERSLGQKGHQHGELEADIVDERHSLVYRIRAEDDGRGGSLVRVDVDPSAARAKQILGVALGGGAAAVGAGLMLMLGFSVLFTLGVLGVASIGLAFFLKAATGERQGLAQARDLVAGALVAAEEEAAHRDMAALPPGDDR